jgi:hypothetical protein
VKPPADSVGYSIRIFLPDGNPNGIKVVEKSNWSGRGIVFPRVLFPEAKKRPELAGPGVYVLAASREQTELRRVYIGESDQVRPRIDQHLLNKDFWTEAAIFTSKDQNLNKAHVQHLEYRLLALATEAKRCDLDNGNVPAAPPLSEADRAEAEGFLANMLLCFPVLGMSFFDRPEQKDPGTIEFSLKSAATEARGYPSAQGFVVRRGARAAKTAVPSVPRHVAALRSELLKQDVLGQDGNNLVLQQDYPFSSPSSAAGVLLGRSANGLIEWKAPNGKTLKQIQEADIAAAPTG